MASAKVVSLIIINAFLSVFGTCMTFLVIMAILQNAELQKGLNLLIVSLTAADLTNCLIAQPMYVYYLGNEVGGTYLVAFETIAFIGLHAVFTNLTAITYHRMKALSRPFHHLLLVSRKDLVVVIMLTWVVSIVVGVVFATEPGKRVGAYFHAVMILSLVLTYIKILWVSWRRRRRKIAEQVGTANYYQQAATIEHENAAAITSAILVGTTLLCFLPDVVLDVIGEGEVNRRLWTYTLLFSSSALNPCIVIWRNQRFRRAVLDTFRLRN